MRIWMGSWGEKMNPYSIFTIFDWVTPAIEMGREIKNLAHRKDEHYLFVNDGFFSRNIGTAMAVLDRAGIPYRRGIYTILGDRWTIHLDPKDVGTAMSAMNQAGVKYR